MRTIRNYNLAALILVLLTISCFSGSANLLKLVPKSVDVIYIDITKIKLDDGDTFSYDGMDIRVLGMDTPEIAHPEHGFHKDQPFGREASAYTAELIEKAKKIAYVPFQEDRYGRMLAHVFIDGELLSVKLIKVGLAYETVSHYGDNGFPELADVILEAAENSQTRDFMPPYKWRQQNRDRK